MATREKPQSILIWTITPCGMISATFPFKWLRALVTPRAYRKIGQGAEAERGGAEEASTADLTFLSAVPRVLRRNVQSKAALVR